MTAIRAHFDGKAFVPDEPVNVPVDHPAVVQVEIVEPLNVVSTEHELSALFAEMDQDAVDPGHHVDYSRESIYGGTLDDSH